MKKFFSVIAAVVIGGKQIVEGFLPFISALNPKAAPIAQKAEDSLTLIGRIFADIQIAGASAGLTPEQKLAAAVPLVAKVIRESELLVGHKVSADNLEAFLAKIKVATSALYDAMDMVDPDGIKTA